MTMPEIITKLRGLQDELINDAIKCAPYRCADETWKALLTGKTMGYVFAADRIDDLVLEIEEEASS